MCEHCQYRDGCRQVGLLLTSEPLNAEDWAEVYRFMRHAYFPFIHSIVVRARRRAGMDTQLTKPSRVWRKKRSETE